MTRKRGGRQRRERGIRWGPNAGIKEVRSIGPVQKEKRGKFLTGMVAAMATRRRGRNSEKLQENGGVEEKGDAIKKELGESTGDLFLGGKRRESFGLENTK